MSVLLAVAVRPKIGKPYALIGVDSKRVKGVLKSDDNSNLNNLDIIEIQENYEKAFKLNNFIYGFTGMADDEVIELIKEYMSNNDKPLDMILPKLELYVKNILKDNNSMKNQRIVITLAGRFNNEVILGQIQADKDGEIIDINSGYLPINKTSYIEIFAGRTREYDLQKEFKEMMNSSTSLQKQTIIKFMRKYLKKAAARYPKTCNQNIRILELD